jgi:site-specific recombinase XerD
MSVATSRSYADQWLETKKPETARATLHSYSITIFAFLDFLGSKADRDLSEVARADLIAFRNSLAGKLSSTSINRYISVLRMLFKTAKRDGYVLENPAKRAESRLSFHSLRHTAVSLLKDAGIPQAAVQELIGHQSASISQLYTHVGRESLLKAASALPKI